MSSSISTKSLILLAKQPNVTSNNDINHNLKQLNNKSVNSTNNKITVPVHIYYRWKDDKIISIYRMFDPVTLKEEIAASLKK